MMSDLIMIVDDSPTNIDILAATLKDQYRLTIAKSGQTAMDRIDKQIPDLILLDILMPEMDGFEVCRRLKADKRTRDIPVIFITAVEAAEHKTRGFELGAVDYITRPFHKSEVLARVRTHLAMRQMHRELNEKNRSMGKALAEKSRQLDALIANLPGMVYHARYDNGWQSDFVSDGCIHLTEYSPEAFYEHKGPHHGLITDADNLKRISQTRDDALAAGRSFEMLYPIKTASGKEKWVLEQGAGVTDENGNLTGTEGVISDVTEKQRAALALQQENRHLRSVMPRDQFGDIVGGSPAMQKVYDRIIKAAACEDCVIIYGQSGTGKELVARAIHKNSPRKNKTFVPINCGAIPEGLFESEFFGHKKGAFSGANTDKEGVLDMADGGTLFLDELGEISLSMQVKLLRVMDGNGYIPVGGTVLKTPDIRFVCATNRDLQERIRQKKLREDFFFRVHIIPINLPPLRERREDIPLLIEHFFNSYPKDDTTASLTPEIMDALMTYAWPGNIRQLQNMVYQFLVLGKMDFLDPDTIKDGNIQASLPGDLKTAVEEFEKNFITRALTRYKGKKGKVAQALKVDRKTLFRKMKRYELN
ncbi:MAG: sigma 54-interacting transcriptional regulator [Desulfobacterales bacterium]|nr:sigma 54-interacting transcriptional regulator [Desulfobacterales bacterium]